MSYVKTKRVTQTRSKGFKAWVEHWTGADGEQTLSKEAHDELMTYRQPHCRCVFDKKKRITRLVQTNKQGTLRIITTFTYLEGA